MRVSFTLTQCANQCLLDSIRVGNTTVRWINLRLDKTKVAPLRIKLCPTCKQLDRNAKSRAFTRQESKRKIDCYEVDGYCDHCKTVFEAMGCYYNFCEFMEVSPLLSEEEIKRGQNRRELDRLRKEYIESKGYKVVEQWECKWKEQFIKNSTVKH